MSEAEKSEHDSLPLSFARRLDEACFRFEMAWKAGQRPRIEDWLRDMPEPERAALLRELIALEIEYRREAGEEPQLEEYQARFPGLALSLAVTRPDQATLRPDPLPRLAADLPTVPGYEILKELGRGGMGVVYQARHLQLNRLVALKMILAGSHAAVSELHRFRAEAEAVARLQHPHIVQIFEVGEHAGLPYFALEYCSGGSLASRLQGTPQPARQAAQLVQTLARAIHASHQQGIIHRDLKPANVLLQMADGRWQIENQTEAVAGKSAILNLQSAIPKITDFGLAKKLESAAGPTVSGAVMGTPSYMAPEQAAGQRSQIGPATDVYALGAILYELLTGRPPFKAATPLETVLQVQTVEPVPPSRLQPKLPRDLTTICLKCLRKEPGQRYAGAGELAEDLRRFLEGRPIQARAAGVWERTVKWVRRRPAVAALGAGICVILALGFAGVTWQWLEANEQRGLANANARQANAEKQAALRGAYLARLAAAGAALSAHDVADAARHLDAAPEELRGWEWRHLHSRLDDSSAVIPLPEGKAGFLLAALGRLRVAALTPTGLRLTDPEGGEPRTLPIGPERGRLGAVTQTRRGIRIVAWVGDTKVDLLDEAGQVLCRVATPPAKEPGYAVVSPDGTRLACGRFDGERMRLAVFDAKTGKRTAVCDGHRAGIRALTFSPDGTRLASGGEDRTACLWDAASGALRATCRGHTSKVLNVAFSPDGARLVTASADGTVRQWEAATGREVEAPYDRHSGEVACAVYSPDGQWVASAGTDRTVRVWRATGRQDVAVLHGHTGAVVEVAFTPDGRRLASVSRDSTLAFVADGTVRVWDVDPRATLPVLRGHTSYVYAVAYSPDGRWIASGSGDGTVRLWDAWTGEECAKLPHTSFVRALAFSPDSSRLVSGCEGEERLHIWNACTGSRHKDVPGPGKILQALAVSPGGARIAAVDQDGSLSIREAATGQQIASLRMTGSFTRKGLAYSPDGRWLAGTGADQKIYLWATQTNQLAATLAGHRGDIYSVAFSPDGCRLVSAGQDRTVRVWDVGTQACLAALQGHTDEVFTAVFHPDGTRIASAGRDQAIRLWDVAMRQEVARLPGHSTYVFSLAFSADGATLVSASGDGTVRLWDTAPLKMRYQERRAAEALRPAAERLVERLFGEKQHPAAIVAALRGDTALSEPLRQAAFRAVLRRQTR